MQKIAIAVIFVGFFLFGSRTPVVGQDLGSPQFLVKGPWATATVEGVVVSFELSEPIDGRLAYAPAGNELENGIPFTGEKGLHHVLLADLKPDTLYAYRILFEEGSRSPVGHFRTPPDRFVPFTFLVYGDTRTFYDRHRVVAQAMAEDDAVFAVHTGDFVESPTQAEWNAFFTSGSPLFLSKLFFPVIGNHERNSITYYRLFALPGAGGKMGKEWWYFYWGGVLFVGLDSNTQYLGFKGLQVQTNWLKDILSREAHFKFVFFHHPLFSSDPHYGSNEGLARLWHPIFVENEVTAVFCGHVHAYEHIVRDGIHYVTTGGGGAPLYPLGEPIEGTVFSAAGLLHYMRVTVGEDSVQVEMVPVASAPLGEEQGGITLLDKEPLETFTIEAPAPIPIP